MRTFASSIVGFCIAGCVADQPAEDLSTVSPELFVSEPDTFRPAAGAAPIALRDAANQPMRPVHVNLMPDGRVLMIGRDGNAGLLAIPSLATTLPASLQLAAAQPPTEFPTTTTFGTIDVIDSLFCGGHTQLADGSLLTVGGTRFALDHSNNYFYVLGLGYATRLTATGVGWTRNPNQMTVRGSLGEATRWYPQATALEDGRVLVLSGWEMPFYGPVGGTPQLGGSNISAEIYDPASQTFTPMTDATATPIAVFNPDYSHVFTLPYPDAIDGYALGESAAPVLFGVDARVWVTRLTARPGNTLRPDGTSIQTPNNGASSAMLPIRVANGEWGYFNGAALVAGGAHNTANEHAVDVYDPIADRWLPRIDMQVRRHHPSTIVLPDGRMLVIAGHDDSSTSGDRIQRALYVDPKLAFRVTEGTSLMGEVRGYHTVSLLLPDGRVLIGGGRTAGPDSLDDEKDNLRFYYPSYMMRTRPTMTAAPTVLRYATSVSIGHSAGVTEVVLIGLGSMTHSFDSHQRYVQLSRTTLTATSSAIAAPPNRETAPPGYYMLFVLDGNRTPSMARIVRVGP